MKKSIACYTTFENLLTIDWNKSVSFALRKIREFSKSCLLVVNKEGGVIGIVTENDKESDQKLDEFCQRPLKTISLEEGKGMNSIKAAQYMRENGFHRIVIKDGEKIGIFTSTDFIKMVAEGD
ncbi:MAG: CBS domain-containing protein [bacterium]|nr:CBS domain-containing protein [bacterium]